MDPGARLLEELEKSPSPVLYHFACDCAQWALESERKEGRSLPQEAWQALDIARLWLEGDAADSELERMWDIVNRMSHDYPYRDLARRSGVDAIESVKSACVGFSSHIHPIVIAYYAARGAAGSWAWAKSENAKTDWDGETWAAQYDISMRQHMARLCDLRTVYEQRQASILRALLLRTEVVKRSTAREARHYEHALF